MEIRKYTCFIFAVTIYLFTTANVSAQITERERPKEWNNLVPGARFLDRFMAMPKGILSSETWGAENVKPRYIDNGIEDRINSYWGGNIAQGEDHKYHLFVCGWREDSPKGHAEWPNSIVYHTISDNPIGPFQIKDTIGPGHNPEIFRLNDSRYVIYVIDGYYLSHNLNGPWSFHKFEFDERDRPIIEGLSNLTFSKREDGSYLMVCRGGGIWISRTGLSVYNQISEHSVYPPVAGEFEDPVVWRDHIQYHLIVNDWLGRIAFYQRSKDGIKWITDPGEAYVPGISFHEDGYVENWFKYERMKILQDEYGRAVQANFAVIDVLKKSDLPNDNHSSKNISIPLNPGLLLTMLETEITENSKTIRLKIISDKGFDPHKDIDIASLRFGASSEVNYGNGCKVLKTEKSGNDLIVTFDAQGHGITPDEFAPKLIGKDKRGGLLYGYVRLPWISYVSSILSCRKPVINSAGMDIIVENFGQEASFPAYLTVFYEKDGRYEKLAGETVPQLDPYDKTTVTIPVHQLFDEETVHKFKIEIEDQINPSIVSIFETTYKN